MTTAHRPTFDPARGKDAQRGPAYHQRLLPAHKTLKFRQANQGTEGETSRRDLRAELLRKERKHLASKTGQEYHSSSDEEDASAPAAAITASRKRSHDDTPDAEEETYEAKKARVLAETQHLDASSSGSESSSSEESDDEDEEAMLQAELAKIRRERAEVAAKEAAAKQAVEEEQREVDVARGNPLLNAEGTGEYGVKRRWDDDVVFKNQGRGTADKDKKKEFVNDLLRSDFHRRFMSRYVR